MFENELQQIVSTLAANNPLFKDKGFIKRTRVVGGFQGFTNQYDNYFFGQTNVADIEKYNFNTDHDTHGFGQTDMSFNFQLIFQTKCKIPNFLEIIFVQLLKIDGIKISNCTDDTEIIYAYETGQELQSNDFQLYRFDCSFDCIVDVAQHVSCLDLNCIDNSCCK